MLKGSRQEDSKFKVFLYYRAGSRPAENIRLCLKNGRERGKKEGREGRRKEERESVCVYVCGGVLLLTNLRGLAVYLEL